MALTALFLRSIVAVFMMTVLAQDGNSVARKEKEIYGSKFDPFFRTEQLIIRPTRNLPRGYHPQPYDNFIPFGPIFHLDLLNQALDLQNYIANMTVETEDGETVRLQDICFQPKTNVCAIESLFQYFQNNKTRLNKCLSIMGYDCDEKPSFDVHAYDYHDHVLLCTGSPTSDDNWKLKESCLSAYGGPIMPDMVLDGFDGKAYQNATTLIITFVVNNHKDTTKLKKAMAWEKAFIEYMKGYTKDPKNGNLTISFSAERAIQGERDRETPSVTDITI